MENNFLIYRQYLDILEINIVLNLIEIKNLYQINKYYKILLY